MNISELAEKYNIDKKQFYSDGKTAVRGHNYVALYDKYFEQYRDKEINILEIGIAGGFSLELWADAFPKAKNIIGADKDASFLSRKFSDPRIQTFYMDQGDINSIRDMVNKGIEFDIIIDDGSHQSRHMIDCFNLLFPLLKWDGIYVAEDTYQSFHPEYSSYDGNFISFLKEKVDDINWSKNMAKLKNHLDIRSIHFYNEIVFILKGDCITY
jgi:hypothetical protein